MATTITNSVLGFGTLGSMLDDYRGQIGGIGGTRDSRIVQWINQAVQDIAGVLPDDILLASFSVPVVSGTTTYDLDSATYLFKDLFPDTVQVTDASGEVTVPPYKAYHTWQPFKVNDDGSAGQMSYYTILPVTSSGRRQIEFYTAPTASYTVTGSFVYWPGRLTVGQDETAIPLPGPCQYAVELFLDWKAAQFSGRAQGDIQMTQNTYETKRMELSHQLHRSNLMKFGRVDPGPLPGVIYDYTDLT